jgi:hypothetical protein
VGMKRKLVFYVQKLISNDLAPFPILKQCFIDCKIDLLTNDNKSLIICHLNGIKDEFDKYFPKDTIEHVWILNPFIYDAYNLPEEFKTPAQKELLSLTFDISLKQRTVQALNTCRILAHKLTLDGWMDYKWVKL